jgi:copper homeostasis protein (lipoprotein)
MGRRIIIISLFVVLLSVSGIESARGADPHAVIQGTAFYRERMALPPEAVFEAVIADISRADAPADVLGRVRLESPGQVPIRFEIPYDPARVDETHLYGVRASITVGGQLWFTTDRFYPVLTGSHSARVDLLLVRVSAAPPAGAAPGAAGLGGDPQRGIMRWGPRALPASFEGDLPAADGPGLRYHLDLFPDQAFVLRRDYLGRPGEAQVDEIGTWAVSGDGGRLTLQGERAAPVQLSIGDSRTLRLLDREGRQIESRLNYDLTRLESFAPIEPRLLLRGMYRYRADAGTFQECLTGWRLPVAPEGDNAALESAYTQARPEPGEPLLVTLQGRIANRPRREGAGLQRTLVPEHFIHVWPGETCGPRSSQATLENTYWKLTRLGTQPAELGAGGREVFLTLVAEGRRVQGFSGCNRFIGGYQLDGRRLAFQQMARTQMACPEGMEQEDAFLNALEATASWEIRGEHLELYSAEGVMLLRFESRYMG